MDSRVIDNDNNRNFARDILVNLMNKIKLGKEEVNKMEIEQLVSTINNMNHIEKQKHVPYLNREYLRTGGIASHNINSDAHGNSLPIVRFVGMVQDMMDPEYYLVKQNGVLTKYRDYYQHDDHCSDYTSTKVDEMFQQLDLAHELAERQPLVLVPLPFESDWVKEHYTVNEKTHKNFTNKIEQINTNDNSESKSNQENLKCEKRKRVHLNNDVVEKRNEFKVKNFKVSRDECDTASNIPEICFSEDSNSNSTEEGEVANQRHVDDWWPQGCMGSDVEQCPVLAKMYYDNEEDTMSNKLKTPTKLQLNDIVEVIGVLCMDPLYADFSAQKNKKGFDSQDYKNLSQNSNDSVQSLMDKQNFWGDDTDHLDTLVLPPPSLLPRLHVLHHQKIDLDVFAKEISDRNSNELISESEKKAVSSDSPESCDDRSFTIKTLSEQIFEGNNVAAEALLVTLLSAAERGEVNSEGRRNPIQMPSGSTLGCASLKFILPDSLSCEVMRNRLNQVLSQILPVVASADLYLSLLNGSSNSIGNVNYSMSAPIKNIHGRLEPSIMQLPRGSCIILNEGALTPGSLNERGIKTLSCFSKLAHDHSVPYRFGGMMDLDFEADYRVIVLSSISPDHDKLIRYNNNDANQDTHNENKLQTCCLEMHLGRARIASDTMKCNKDESLLLPSTATTRIRRYLSRCRGFGSMQNINLTRRILIQAEKDFIQRRQKQRKRSEESKVKENEIGEVDFHRWLTITRIQARSRTKESGQPFGNTSELYAEKLDWASALRLDDLMKSSKQ